MEKGEIDLSLKRESLDGSKEKIFTQKKKISAKGRHV